MLTKPNLFILIYLYLLGVIPIKALETSRLAALFLHFLLSSNTYTMNELSSISLVPIPILCEKGLHLCSLACAQLCVRFCIATSATARGYLAEVICSMDFLGA